MATLATPTPAVSVSPPAELRQLPQWVCWASAPGGRQFEYPNGHPTAGALKVKSNGKPHKLPINPHSGGPAQTNVRLTWAQFNKANEASKRWRLAGTGFVFTAADPYAGVDLDDCRDPHSGQLAAWARKIVDALASYTEVSPSETGLKIWIRGKLPPGGRQFAVGTGKVEMFDQGRYFTFTGRHLQGTPLEIRAAQDAINALHAQLDGSQKAQEHPPAPSEGLGLSDDEVIAKAKRAKNGSEFERLWRGDWAGHYPSQSEADQELCARLVFWTRGDAAQIDRLFRSSGLMREKWDNQRGYAEATIKKALSRVTDRYEPRKRHLVRPSTERPKGKSETQEGSRSPEDRRGMDGPGPDAKRVTTPDGDFLVDRRKGVYAAGENNTRDIWLSPWIEPAAETESFDGGEAAILFRFADSAGVEQGYLVPFRLFVGGQGQEGLNPLIDRGFRPHRNPKRIERLKSYLYFVPADLPRLKITGRIGWHGECFVLPERTFGGDYVKYFSDRRGKGKYQIAGTLDQWRDKVARYATGNQNLMLAISAAFAAPLLTPLKLDGGGFHFYGTSSTGKSTAMYAAGSVWGGGPRNGFLESWKATGNGMEAQASLHNDCLLLLDEIREVNPKDVSEIVYALANGRGKARMEKTGSSRPAAEFRVLFLSSGELQQSDLANEVGKALKGGQAARMVQLPGDDEREGAFDDLHDFDSASKLADAIRENACTFYGTPIQPFLEYLTANIPRVCDQALAAKDAFTSDVVKKAPSNEKIAGEIFRVASRFAAVAFAGDLATKLGITGWRSGDAIAAAKSRFQAWIAGRGGMGIHEAAEGIRRIRSFIQQHASRFQRKAENEDVRDRAGWLINEGEGECYCFFPALFDQTIAGLNEAAVVKELIARKLLLRDDNGFKRKVRLPDGGRPRLVVISAEILNE